MSLATGLSTKDQHVLSAILSSGDEPTAERAGNQQVVVDMEMPPDRHVSRVEELVRLEKEAIKLVEEGGTQNMETGMTIFNDIIDREPLYASAYNNRAQLRRLLQDGTNSRQSIIEDLKKAIELAQPVPHGGSSTIRVSKMQGTILCQAYTQLGGMYLSLLDEGSSEESSRWELEENASTSLHFAGLFGNELASAVATKVNPYAQLCGNMVKEALVAEYCQQV